MVHSKTTQLNIRDFVFFFVRAFDLFNFNSYNIFQSAKKSKKKKKAVFFKGKTKSKNKNDYIL